MTHISAAGSAATKYNAVVSLASRPTEKTPADRRLDKEQLLGGVTSRRRRLAQLESELAGACERAAARHAPRSIVTHDRATWDRPMWQRYLAAAARLEPEYGPPMRRILQDIDRLQRLAEIPAAA